VEYFLKNRNLHLRKNQHCQSRLTKKKKKVNQILNPKGRIGVKYQKQRAGQRFLFAVFQPTGL